MDWSSILAGLGGMGGLTNDAPMPDFNDRFGAAFPQHGLAPSPMQSPISPEALASNAAARGVPPPPVDVAPPIRMPDAGAVEAWRSGVDADMAGGPGSVGAALTGKTMPMDIRPPIQAAQQDAPTDMSAQSKKPETMDKLAEGLKGVKAPAGPELQRLGTPTAPRPTGQIKGGELVALLQLLNSGQTGSGYNLPSTLGAALRK